MRRQDLLLDLTRDLTHESTTVATPRRPWPSLKGARPTPSAARSKVWLVPLVLLALGSLLVGIS